MRSSQPQIAIAFAAAFGTSLALSACSAAPPADGEPPAPAKPAPATPTAAQPAPSAKISADMVGKVSPIPAFRGVGKDWMVEISALDATQHSVVIHWTRTNETAGGTATYRGALDTPRGKPLALTGMVQTGPDRRLLAVEIVTAPCKGADGVEHPQRITITIEGRPDLKGCGDLAMY